MICPKCNKEIRHLIYEEEVTLETRYEIGTHGTDQYSEVIRKPITSNYICPSCRNKLAKYEEDAHRLLENRKVEIRIKDLKSEVIEEIGRKFPHIDLKEENVIFEIQKER